jgi:hypothetical protein
MHFRLIRVVNKTLFFDLTAIILTFSHRFLAAYYDSVLSFFPAFQVSEIVLNESSKSTENALIE